MYIRNKLIGICLLCSSVTVLPQEHANEARILSVYHGLDPVPPMATRLCGMEPVRAQDGMPVTFSVQIDNETVLPSAFTVKTSTNNLVTPICATLRPADELLEQRTVLLIGSFSPGNSKPVSVEIVDHLRDIDGNSLLGLQSQKVTSLESGPSLVHAERFAPGTPGLEDECPQGITQAILLTWEGGVTGPSGVDLDELQRTAITLVLENDTRVNPVSLGDDDPDNHVIACVTQKSPAISIVVSAGFFYDPGNDPNPETSVDVIQGKFRGQL